MLTSCSLVPCLKFAQKTSARRTRWQDAGKGEEKFVGFNALATQTRGLEKMTRVDQARLDAT